MSLGAIIAGTGVYKVPGMGPAEEISTPFGEATVFRLKGSPIVFLPRHGIEHTVPPHRINYRANMWALHQIGVDRVLATYAVGSLLAKIPAGSVLLLDDFLDFTVGRTTTLYDGDDWGVAHADMTMPFCGSLREALLEQAPAHGLQISSKTGTYVCKDGPRFESPAEVRMLAQVGGDVVGMTGVPEVTLARELGLHFAAMAISINLGVGLESELRIVRDLDQLRAAQTRAFLKVLQSQPLGECHCSHSVHFFVRPEGDRFVSRACRE
jgi:5'-methylthioadenosine phosphorylase